MPSRSMPDSFANPRRVTLICGHYGCGKTNLALNLALDFSARYATVTLVDLDVVNPYFRSSDQRAMLAERGVNVVAPHFAGTTVEAPALPAAVETALRSATPVLVDVGGDDAGATTLGRFAGVLAPGDYDLLYVINRHRNLTSTPAAAAALLAEIEAAAHLTATGVINNSHLQAQTTTATILESLPFAAETARLLDLPLICTTVPSWLGGRARGAAETIENAYPVEIYVRPPWEQGPSEDEEGSNACQ